MEFIDLKADVRKRAGRSVARELRRKGKIPAVFYGSEGESFLLSIEQTEFEKVFKKGTSGQVIFNLIIQNNQTHTSLVSIKELQIDPVSRNYLHIDFYKIDMSQKIKVKVPVIIKGKSKGVELGGLLQIIRRELEVLCMPIEIPAAIEIDVTDLGIGDSIHVEDIILKENIEIPTDVNFTVITVLSPKIEKEVTEIEEEEEEEAGAEKADSEENDEK